MNDASTIGTPGAKISVVMTTYNGEQFLEQQINSVLLQTLQPSEIIVCDDGSTDDTVKILERFSQHPGFTFYRNETRLGVVENFKKAVSFTTAGNYIALCDQDDIWLPEKLERSLSTLLQIEDPLLPSMVYSDLILIDDHNKIISHSVITELGHHKYRHCLETLLFVNFVLGCTILMNPKMKEFFADIPNNNTYHHDAWIALIAFTFGRIAMLDHPYIKYRKHGRNVTLKGGYRKRNFAKKIKDHTKAIFLKTDLLEVQLSMAGSFYEIYKDRLSAQHKKKITGLLKLTGRSYVRKKMAFEIAFANNWIKRF